MLKWDDIRILLELSRSSSTRDAAKRLGLNISTISRRLQALEASLNTVLFNRESGRLTITAEGERIVEQAERMEDAAVRIEHSTRSDGTPAAGRVRVATTRTMSNEIVYPVAERLSETHPQVIPEVDAHAQWIDLMKGEAELALTCWKPTHPRLVSRHVFTAVGSLYGTREYMRGRPVPTAESFDGHDIIGMAEVNMATAVGPWFEESVHGGNIVMRTSSAEEMLRLCLAGRGLGICFSFRAEEHPNLVRVKAIPLMRLPHWIVIHPDLQHVARVRVVVDALQDRIEQVRDRLENVHEPARPNLELVPDVAATERDK